MIQTNLLLKKQKPAKPNKLINDKQIKWVRSRICNKLFIFYFYVLYYRCIQTLSQNLQHQILTKFL